MKPGIRTGLLLFVILLGMAACREDAALPTETATMAQIATPTAAALETKAPPTETAIPTKPDPTATPTRTATATAPPTATASPTTEPTLTTAPSKVEEIRFQSRHFTLVGDLQIPGTEGKHPAIIMVHGDGRINRTDSGKYRPIVERFLRAGYAVFSWDKPGTGESSGEFADGAWIITDRASILVDAVEFLKGHPAIDPQRIGMWGISQAGAVMPMALTMTDEFAFMIVVSGPAVDSIDQTAYLIGQQLLCEGYSEEEARLAEQSYASLCKATTYQEFRESKEYLIQFPYATNFVGREISPEEDWSPWNRDVDAFFNPMEVIERTTIPVLAFFGERDTQVDPFQGAQAYEEALQKAGNPHSHVELVPETDHNIVLSESGCMAARDRRSRADWLKYTPDYLDLMEEWLVQLLSSLPPLGGSGGGGIAFSSGRDGNDEIYAQLEGLPLDEFFDQSYRLLQLRDPDALVVNGLADEYGVANDRFTDMSDDYVRQTQQLESAILDLLHTYDRSALPPDQQLSYDVYQWVLEDRVRGHQFTYCDYPVNSMTIWGKQNWLVDFMVNYQPITGKQDAQDYIARLSQIDTWVEQLLEGLRLREQAGAIPPRDIVQGSRHQVEGHLQMQGTGSFRVEAIQLYTSFREKLEQVETISAEEAQVLLDAALAEIKDTFVPAFLELRDYLAHLETVATDKPAVCKLPDGEAYYVYMLRHETSTNTSPEQIHELGLAQVARLQAEIQEAAAEQGYPQDISLAELDERIRIDSQLLTGDALLAEYQRLIAEADRAADAFFDLRPTTKVVVETEPFGSGLAYYTSPPLDGSGPGKFFTNLNSAAIRYLMPTVTFHETIPGHHFQIALARELDLPTFRRELLFNAYAEGWALYAEQLAWEMGLYDDDPLGNLGRLELELARAARLVVDTGIHAKGWSAQVAADYYQEATGRLTDPSAMHRYIILPGQGCGYTIGLLKILELRQRAMDQLGDQFDIKEFHNVVLGSGSLPLELLERVVQRYIDANPGGM